MHNICFDVNKPLSSVYDTKDRGFKSASSSTFLSDILKCVIKDLSTFYEKKISLIFHVVFWLLTNNFRFSKKEN